MDFLVICVDEVFIIIPRKNFLEEKIVTFTCSKDEITLQNFLQKSHKRANIDIKIAQYQIHNMFQS